MVLFIKPYAKKNMNMTGRKESRSPDDYASSKLRAQNQPAFGKKFDEIAAQHYRKRTQEDQDRESGKECQLLIAAGIAEMANRKMSARRLPPATEGR